jgi:thiol-disulfide isomerase/thioredoxin
MLPVVIAAVLAAAPSAQQPARPATVVSQVRTALAAHDLDGAEALVKNERASHGETPDLIEAVSWLGRGAQAEKQPERAVAWAEEAMRLALAALGGRPVDADAHLANAVGASIEVQALVAVDRGERSDAVVFLERQLAAYRGTSLSKRIQKNINLVTLEGHPAPTLESPEWIGIQPPTFADLKGRIVVLFFWAHWCPDCKAEGPILAKLYDRYQKDGLTIVAPTQRFGYVAGGVKAPPDEELRYIVQVRDQYYPFLANVPVPVSVTNHERYGVSTTPTVVIVDRRGIIRLYHPGKMTEAELDAQIKPLL